MTRRHKIAIIAGQLVVGGAERQLYLWLSNLDRERFQPVVLTLHPGHNDYWEIPIRDLGIPLITIPHRCIRLVRVLDIARVLLSYKPQLIHGWHLFASPYAGLTAKLLGAKSLGGVRGAFRAFRDHSWESRLTLWFVDAIMANSSSVAEQLKAVRWGRKQIVYTVQNAVEDQAGNRLIMREALTRRFGFANRGVWIGSIGRLDPGKRFDNLLKALALLSVEVKDFHFLLVGDGPERGRLERMADELGIRQYVTFTGEVPGASAWLGALDIFCFTSLDEGLPNAVMEAAAAGVSIVSWRVPFIEEILKGREVAYLVEPEDLVGFKNALVALSHSPALRSKLGQAARKHVLEAFSLKKFVQHMTCVYEDLLGDYQGTIGLS
jgi:glycosyltransferase involved in cell wall biosynthesis